MSGDVLPLLAEEVRLREPGAELGDDLSAAYCLSTAIGLLVENARAGIDRSEIERQALGAVAAQLTAVLDRCLARFEALKDGHHIFRKAEPREP